jgi:hypothetical protein
VQDGQQRGVVLKLHTVCSRCGHKANFSNITGWPQLGTHTGGSQGPATHPFNLEGVAAVVLNGGTYVEYKSTCHTQGLSCLVKRAY